MEAQCLTSSGASKPRRRGVDQIRVPLTKRSAEKLQNKLAEKPFGPGNFAWRPITVGAIGKRVGVSVGNGNKPPLTPQPCERGRDERAPPVRRPGGGRVAVLAEARLQSDQPRRIAGNTTRRISALAPRRCGRIRMSRPRAEAPAYTLERRGASYSVRWWDGKRSCRVPCRTKDKAEAERFLADFIAGAGATLPPASVTIGAILDGYEAHRSRRTHSTTLQTCIATLKRHMGALTAELLTNDRTERYQADRRKEGAGGASAKYRKRPRPLSNGTLIRELGVLRRALAWATEQNPPWLARAPHVERPEAPAGRDRWLTRHEADRLIAGAATTSHIALFVALAIHTGARSGAILGLTWDRVDVPGRTIDMGDGRGKKRRARRVPINDVLLPYVQTAKASHTTQWVIEYRGEQVGSIKTGFRAATTRAKLRGVTPHILRHTAVTWMMQRNVPIAKIARYVAMSEEMVEKRYGHHSPEWMREASDAMTGDA